MDRSALIGHLIGPAILVVLAMVILFFHSLGQYLKARRQQAASARGEMLPPPPKPARRWPWGRGLIAGDVVLAVVCFTPSS